MTKGLYVDLYNLITDNIGDYEDKMGEMLDLITMCNDCPSTEEFQGYALLAAKYHEKIKSLKRVLDQFEAEVEEPEK